MKASVAVMGTLKFPPDRISDIRPALQRLIVASRKHDGCITYDVAEDCFAPGIIRVSELWRDQDSLTRHSAHPDVPPWHEATRNCGMLGSIYLVFDVDGLKTIAAGEFDTQGSTS
jgi:quinol monooxygenase YgiN